MYNTYIFDFIFEPFEEQVLKDTLTMSADAFHGLILICFHPWSLLNANKHNFILNDHFVYPHFTVGNKVNISFKKKKKKIQVQLLFYTKIHVSLEQFHQVFSVSSRWQENSQGADTCLNNAWIPRIPWWKPYMCFREITVICLEWCWNLELYKHILLIHVHAFVD